MGNEKFLSCRATDNELKYLDTYWDGSFSEYVHNSIKRDIEQIDSNKKRERLEIFNKLSPYVVLMALGTIFFLFGMQTTNLTLIILQFVLGLFLVVMGIAGGMIIALQSTREHNTKK